MVAKETNGFFNVIFADRPQMTFGYTNSSFGDSSASLELAYALTIHKAQGSKFKKVFVVIPETTKLLSRELIYTAMTRSRQQLVLLVEGDDPSILYDLARPEKSDAAKQNTNLFYGVVRHERASVPYAEHLIHRTLKGHMVRSKSELVISNELYRQSLNYEYERELEANDGRSTRLPDFSFVDAAGDVIVWEHLGMLGRPDYRASWEQKKAWYLNNGFTPDQTLFVTQDDEQGGLDASKVSNAASKIKSLL